MKTVFSNQQNISILLRKFLVKIGKLQIFFNKPLFSQYEMIFNFSSSSLFLPKSSMERHKN